MKEGLAKKHRRFIGMIRAELERMDDRPVCVAASWIDEDVAHSRFVLNVPIGRKYKFPVKPAGGFLDIDDERGLARQAEEFAEAILTLRDQGDPLTRNADGIRRAAEAELAGAPTAPLDLELSGVGFMGRYVHELRRERAAEAPIDACARITIRFSPSDGGAAETFDLPTPEPIDVGHAIAELVEELHRRESQ